MNKNGHYHRAIKIPSGWKDNHEFSYYLEYTKNGKANLRQYNIPLQFILDFESSQVFEWQINGNRILNVAIRLDYNENVDIIYVMSVNPNNNVASVITVYLIPINMEVHYTLEEKDYET